MGRGVRPRSHSVVLGICNAFEFGGRAVVSPIGPGMLRRVWRRANQ